MKLSIRVKPNSRDEGVDPAGTDGITRVRVKAAAQEGKANEAVVRVLAAHFNIPKSRIAILRGHTGKNKLVEII